jgi:hypothetical protein
VAKDPIIGDYFLLLDISLVARNLINIYIDSGVLRGVFFALTGTLAWSAV